MVKTDKLRHNLLIAAVLLVAFGLRVAGIDSIPAGLSHDEAYNGVTAIQTLDGQYRVFYEINKGIEPLIIYAEALAFRAFGIGPVQLRLVNIIAGMLTIALVYPLTARLFNRRVALLAMAGLSISFWAIFVSRLTLRAVLLPPLLLLTLYLFWRALTTRSNLTETPPTQPTNQPTAASSNPPANPPSNRPTHHPTNQRLIIIFFALSGLIAGITMYTYLSSRFVPLIVLTVFGYFRLLRQITKWHWLGLLLHFIIWVAIFTPLLAYFIEHQESFTRRADQVSTIPYLLNGEFGPTWRNTGRTLGMFTFEGDTTDRYNLNGRPVFDWVNGLLFYFGLGLMLWRLPRSLRQAGPAVLLLSTLFFMLLPDFITDDSPHFLRTIGALPIVYIVWAVALDTIVQWVERRLAVGQLQQAKAFSPKFITYSLLLLLLLLTTVHTGYDYFVRWANSPDARHIYGADIAAVARYLKNSENHDLPVISAEYYRDLDPFRFVLHFQGSPPFVIWFDGAQTLAFPPAASGLSPRYIFPASAPAADIWTDLLKPAPNESNGEFSLYHRPDIDPLIQLQDSLTPINVDVNHDLQLLGYHLMGDATGGGQFQLLLVWQALRTLPPGTDYTFLVRLLDSQDHVWLESDGNGYDPDDWQPGVVALQLLKFNLPGDLPPQRYHLIAQVVDRRLGQALPTSTGSADALLGPMTARLSDKPRPIEVNRLPNPVDLSRSPAIEMTGLALRGFEVDQRTARAGDELLVTLHWQVERQPTQNYRLQFFLTDPHSAEIYRWPPLPPVSDQWPTGQWPADYWFQDKATLPITSQAPVGLFDLHVAWVDPAVELAPADLLERSFQLGSLKIEPNS